MDNRLNLDEYLHGFHNVQEVRKVFYAIFEEMHRYHNNGCYITNLSFQTISLCFTNPTDIKFLSYEKIGRNSLTDVLKFKHQNVLMLSRLMISSLVYNSNHLIMLNFDFIKQNFNNFRDILTPIDYDYFDRVFNKQEYLYYDDYIRDNCSDNSKFFVEKMKVNEEEAFTTYFLLTINLVVVFMILGCMFLYLT